jgi:phage-related minor tail protein
MSNIDKTLKTTESKLKDIDKLLKLDPTNTDLLKQKQEALNKEIANTKTRLSVLKEAYKDLEGKGTAEAKEQQEALTREIVETEQKLKGLKEQYREFGSVAKQQLGVVGDKMKEVGDKITNIGGQMSAKVTAPIVAGFTLAADKASDYEENLNKLQVAFGEYADEVRAFTDSAQSDFGLSKVDASANASAFGALAKGIGLAEEQAAEMSIELTKLSADLGSYFNTDVETSAEALEAIFTGNTQALKKFGVVMNETNLKEFAKELGMTDKQFAKLGSEDKVLLRYQYVLAQTSDAQGDFARTNEGTANTIKSFQATIEDLTTILGEQLLPIVTPIIQKITEAIQKITQMNPKIFDIAVKIGLVLAALGPVLAMIGTLIKTISGITSAIGFLTTPMGNVILAIGLLVAAGVALYQNWDTIKAKAIELKDKVTEAFEKIRTAIVEKINAAKAALSPFIEKIKEAISWVRNLFSASSEASSISVPRNYVNAMQSGGFGNMMSGGISISNSFVINGVEQLSNARLIEIADVITDRVNENLGVAV